METGDTVYHDAAATVKGDEAEAIEVLDVAMGNCHLAATLPGVAYSVTYHNDCRNRVIDAALHVAAIRRENAATGDQIAASIIGRMTTSERTEVANLTGLESQQRCPKCGHAFHGANACLNMASDNDCVCLGAHGPSADTLRRAGIDVSIGDDSGLIELQYNPTDDDTPDLKPLHEGRVPIDRKASRPSHEIDTSDWPDVKWEHYLCRHVAPGRCCELPTGHTGPHSEDVAVDDRRWWRDDGTEVTER